MRIPFIAGNWKMFKTVQEAVIFAKELRSIVKDVIDVEIVVAPPFTRSMPSPKRCAMPTSAWRRRISTGRRKARSPARSRRR